jgi:FdhD protein
MTIDPTLPAPIMEIPVQLIDDSHRILSVEKVVSEVSVTLNVNGEEWFDFLCTPGDLEYLAAGFLFSSRIIESKHEIASLKLCAKGKGIDVWLSHSVEKPGKWQKNSGCSGGVSISGIKLDPLPETGKFKLSVLDINQILSTFYLTQQIYQTSGGVHGSALFSKTTLLFKAEDIGRHNTLDKIAGQLLFSSVDSIHPLLITTGRISLEMMQKAAMLRASFVISRTSPTSASVELADKLGITLIGYVEKDRCKIYAHPEQIVD